MTEQEVRAAILGARTAFMAMRAVFEDADCWTAEQTAYEITRISLLNLGMEE